MRAPHPSKGIPSRSREVDDVTSGRHVGHAQWYIVCYYYSKKKAREPVTSGDVASGSSTLLHIKCDFSCADIRPNNRSLVCLYLLFGHFFCVFFADTETESKFWTGTYNNFSGADFTPVVYQHRPNNLSLVCLYLSLYISFLLFGLFFSFFFDTLRQKALLYKICMCWKFRDFSSLWNANNYRYIHEGLVFNSSPALDLE